MLEFTILQYVYYKNITLMADQNTILNRSDELLGDTPLHYTAKEGYLDVCK